MKKLSTFIIGLSLALPAFASAASFVVTPSSGSYAAGDTVTLSIAVDPAATSTYTAMLDARFSSDIFEVTSFSMNSQMILLEQPGYDAIDNTKGVLIKTGGYPGGINATTTFGTLVMRVKKDGTGTFTVNDSSKLLDSNNADQQSGNQSVSFTVAAKTPDTDLVTKKSVPLEKTNTQTNTQEVTKPTAQASINDTPVVIAETNKPLGSRASTQLAAVAEFITTNSIMFGLLGMLVLFLGYRYFVRRHKVVAVQEKEIFPTQEGE